MLKLCHAGRNLPDIFSKIGSLCIIVSAPFFSFSFPGIDAGKGWKIFYGIILLAMIILFIMDIFFSEASFLQIIYSVLFFMVIASGLFITTVNFKRIAGESMHRALTVFFIISVLFMPLMILDMNLHRINPDHWIQHFNNITQPLYFLILNTCCIYFVLRYLSQLSLRKDGSFTRYFLEKYQITEREKENITFP